MTKLNHSDALSTQKHTSKCSKKKNKNKKTTTHTHKQQQTVKYYYHFTRSKVQSYNRSEAPVENFTQWHVENKLSWRAQQAMMMLRILFRIYLFWFTNPFHRNIVIKYTYVNLQKENLQLRGKLCQTSPSCQLPFLSEHNCKFPWCLQSRQAGLSTKTEKKIIIGIVIHLL
jgi:hypothetical protein